jgi:cobyrinic acid a,c-diamide synthase
MVKTTVPRVLIAGTAPGVGKSLVVLGLLVALRKQGLSVSCCVTGESLHTALLYSRVTRRYTRVLDRRLLGRSELLNTLYQASLGADLVIIDGRDGLFDGVSPGDMQGSDGELAITTGTPVVLVHVPEDLSESVVSVVRSYVEHPNAPTIGGLIANKLPPTAEGDPFLPHPGVLTLNRFLEPAGLPKFLGGITGSALSVQLPSLALSQEENVTSLPRQFFIDVGNLASGNIDLDVLLQVAKSAANIEISSPLVQPTSRVCRFAVTDDTCFNLCYQDNLDLLRYFGADLVPFSPLADSSLPRKVGGLYVTGAYLKSYGADLSRNENLRRSIKAFADAGGVIYSEGAGTAYLCRSFQLEAGGPSYPGVGLIPAEASPVHRGSALLEAETVDDSVLGFSGIVLRGMSLGDWALGGLHTGSGHHIINTLRVRIPGQDPVTEGYSATAQSCSTFHLLHFGSNPQVAKSLVDAAQVAERIVPSSD